MNSLSEKSAAGRESVQQCISADASETKLLGQLQSGDPAAFEQLVRQHGGRMLATARRFFNDEQDAADAVQDAFISAYKGIKTFKADSLLGTWLHRIVVNSCLMRRRSRDRRPTVAIEDLLPQFDETGHHCAPVRAFHDTPPEKLAAKELRQLVRDSIDRLPESYREVLMLRDIEQLDTEMTAETLGLSAGVVKVRLHRARQALRTLLAPTMQKA